MSASRLIRRPRVATVWLGGCSGCHMSLLDMDERLLDLFRRVDLVYSPMMDAKHFPEAVDVTLVEGAVATEEQRRELLEIRARTTTLVAMGDCASAGNVTALRNPLGSADALLARTYVDLAARGSRIPPGSGGLPRLLDRVEPLSAIVEVDWWIPGCPPPAGTIEHVLAQLIETRTPRLAPGSRFG